MKFFINPYRKIKELQEKLHAMEKEITELQAMLNAEKAKNAKWLELVLGYSPNEAILINKSLWGKKFKVAEVGD